MKIRSFLLVLMLGTWPAAHAEVQLTGDTSCPNISLFPFREPIELTFKATGLTPGERLTLVLDIVDQNDQTQKKLVLPVVADAKGNWAGTTADVPKGKMGFYRVWGQLSNGVRFKKLGSRPEGCITYAIVPRPEERQVYPMDESFFGMCGGFSRKMRDVFELLGIRWCALHVRSEADYAKWKEKQKTDPWNWVTYGWNSMNAICSREWTKEQQDKYLMKNAQHKNTGVFNAAGEDLYKKTVLDYAKRAASQYPETLPHWLYQLTWEPDLYMTNENIIRIHKAAYQAIHDGDPKAIVGGDATSTITRESVEHYRELFAMGFLDYVDAIIIHPYIGFPVEQNGLVENIRKLKGYIKEYGKGKSYKIHGNEFGYSAHTRLDEELTQMNGIVRGNLIFLGEGFASNETFYISDMDEVATGAYGITYNLSLPQIIYGASKISPRPAAPAYAAMTFLLEGHKSAGVIEYLGDTALGYAYQRGDHVVLALWDFGGKPREVDIQVGREKLVTADIMGNQTAVTTDHGVLKLTLTESPVYVIGVDPAIWGKEAVKAVAPDEGRIHAVAGKTIEVRGTLNNTFDKPLNGKLTLAFSKQAKLAPLSQEVSLAPHASKPYSFAVQLPGTLAKGKYPLTLALTADGGNIGANGLLLNVEAPVLVERVAPAFVNEHQALKIRLAEIAGFPVKGTVETRVVGYPEGRRTVDFALDARSSKEIIAELEGLEVAPFDMADVELKVSLDSGYRFTYSEKVNWLSASHQPGVGENGDFSGWKNPKMQRVNAQNVVRSPNYHDGAKDLDASAAFGWNERYLLFRIEVADDCFQQPFTGWKTWAGDSLQFGLARDIKAMKSDNSVADAVMTACSEIDFAITKNGPEIYRTLTFDKDLLPAGPIDLQACPFSVVQERLPDNRARLIYQIAIPWTFLNLPKPKAGQQVFWAATINDLDDPQKQLDVSAIGVFELKQQTPKRFGAITLAP
ncbi:MAG: hypothetical protein WC485_02360 [Opitutaceae bacterium]